MSAEPIREDRPAPEAVPRTGRRVAPGRAMAGAAGLALLGVGAWFFVADVAVAQWLRVLVWLGGGVAVHDGLLAPATAALGHAAAGRAPSRPATVARVAALAVVTVVLLAVPLLATGGLRR